jgi:hypothetical protein
VDHFNYFSGYNQKIISILPVDIKDELNRTRSIDPNYNHAEYIGYVGFITLKTKDKVYNYLDSQFVDCPYIWSINVTANSLFDYLRLIPAYFDIFMGKPLFEKIYYHENIEVRLYENKAAAKNK